MWSIWRVFTRTMWEKPLQLNFAAKSSTKPLFSSIVEVTRSGGAFLSKHRTHTTRKYSKMTTLQFVKMSKNACTPVRGSKLSAGYDLCSAYDYTIPPKEKQLCLTDLQISLPEGCYGRIAPRSGLAHKYFIDVGAGVIDYDYRGNVGVILFNFGNEEFKVTKGDRIAQIICERIFYPEIEEVSSLDDTTRGSNGYGSTGKN